MVTIPPAQAAARRPAPAASAAWPVTMLVQRTLSFALFQGLIALLFAVLGRREPWQASAAWWPVVATLTNLLSLALLVRLFRQEGKRYADLWKFERSTFWRDLLTVIALTTLSMPLAMAPSPLLGSLLFGDPMAANAMLLQALPAWAAWLSLGVFPLTIALAELPTYFAYAMPHVETLTGSRWKAVLLPAIWLSAQHAALPLIFDGRFIVWRLLMFLPFALILGVIIRWRPRLLPYLMIFHGLMDLATAAMVVQVSLG